MLPKRRLQPRRHRHVGQTVAFGRRDLTTPVVARDTELPFPQIHVRPRQRAHLPGPQTRIAAKQHDQIRQSSTRVSASRPDGRNTRAGLMHPWSPATGAKCQVGVDSLADLRKLSSGFEEVFGRVFGGETAYRKAKGIRRDRDDDGARETYLQLFAMRREPPPPPGQFTVVPSMANFSSSSRAPCTRRALCCMAWLPPTSYVAT
jgi:hypothetical protein